ncbi:MAG: protein-export chaperone SecB [Saprospiraceae bacterium]
MEIKNQIKLLFHGVDFPIINFESQNPLLTLEKKLNISIIPKVYFPKESPNSFSILQEINLQSENFFHLFVVAVGSFEIIEEVEEITKKNFVSINAPAIMFPYIRAFISTLTSNLGKVTGTITIPTQFFNGALEEIKELLPK